MPNILSAIACNLDQHILLAALPLLEAEKIEAVEWSFDTLFQHEEVPDWFLALIQEFSDQNRLIGHGVFFSLFSGKWSPEQQNWLRRLEQLSKEFSFDHITEHFGFMTGEDFHKGAPISIPYTAATLALGQDRLKRIQAACHCPVGLENLAFSYSLDEVKKHGEFLDRLVDSVNGFIILDLHNLYCQIHNFDIGFEEIMALYPLHRVREIHISGGSWQDSLMAPGEKIRRDTHDDAVPNEVFDLLEHSLRKCPNLKYVVLEQLGTGLYTEESRSRFQQDFLQMEQIIRHNEQRLPATGNSFLPPGQLFLEARPLENERLYAQQLQLSNILETAGSYDAAQKMLHTSDLAQSEWEVEKWDPRMLETALAIAQKWKHGFA